MESRVYCSYYEGNTPTGCADEAIDLGTEGELGTGDWRRAKHFKNVNSHHMCMFLSSGFSVEEEI